MLDINPFLRPVLVRRGVDVWEYRLPGGNRTWEPLDDSATMTAPEAIVIVTERFGRAVEHVEDVVILPAEDDRPETDRR